jgi:hypothetical protein
MKKTRMILLSGYSLHPLKNQKFSSHSARDQMQQHFSLDHSEDIHVEFMMNAVAKVAPYKK